MTPNRNIELLAPAGSVTGLKAVIAAGADAVYIGGSRFGARAYAANPGEDDLLHAIDYAHLRGVKVYMTVNTLLKDSEMEDLYDYMLPYYTRGVDAVLVQDFGVLRFLHRCFPDLPLHASTQMTVTGPESAKLLKKYGVTRVVPAREMSLNELFTISRESGLEVEAFVHGALCVCMSGMCLASSLIGGRSGNRGRCAQPCRLVYEAEGRKAELLSPKDLCTLDLLPDMIEHGVVSLKIEGRMKQPEYAAGVVSIYRKYLDLYLNSGRKAYRVSTADRDCLMTLFNRDGFTDGYLKKHNGKDMMAFSRRTLNTKEEQERSALYERMHDAYVSNEKKVPLRGTLYVSKGQPLTMTLETADDRRIPKVSLTEQGDAVQEALSRPLGKERLAAQMGKTGGTDFVFTDLDVYTDEDSFVPMGALNSFRRHALDAVRDELLTSSKRLVPAFNRSIDVIPIKRENPANISYAVAVETADQFSAAVSHSFVRRIYISEILLEEDNDLRSIAAENPEEASDAGCDPETGAHDYIQRARLLISICQKRGIEPCIMLPYIERQGYMPTFYQHLEELISEGTACFLARSFETASHLRNLGFANRTILDADIYTWNAEALMWAEENGFIEVTAPYELNKKELRRRDNSGSEIIVYGRIPLMVTVQCLRKNLTECSGRPGIIYLRDRTKRVFPVKHDCIFCYNTVYNSEILSLISEKEFLDAAGFTMRRISLTTETYAESENVLLSFERAYHGMQPENLTANYTKGHFNRGVE